MMTPGLSARTIPILSEVTLNAATQPITDALYGRFSPAKRDPDNKRPEKPARENRGHQGKVVENLSEDSIRRLCRSFGLRMKKYVR